MNNNKSKKLKIFFQNESLIRNNSSIERFDPSLCKPKESSIFMGFGLCTATKTSSGVPFDILGMILPAEKIRKKLKLKSVIIQIADTHAATNTLKKSEIKTARSLLEEKLKSVITKLELENFKILRASDLKGKKATFEKTLSPIFKKHKFENDYIRKEVLDIEFFRQIMNSCIKLSWIIPGEQNSGNDERLFDNLHLQIFGSKVNFLHIEPGFTFEKEHWRCSPYIHIEKENRILLEKDECVAKKIKKAKSEWKDKSLSGSLNHLKAIVRSFESLFGNLTHMKLEEKVEFIIKKIST